MKADRPIQIDLERVIADKLGNKARMVPRPLVRALSRYIRCEELNALLRDNFPRRDAEFCRGVLADLDVKVEIRGAENFPESGRVIFASNHPLGGLDGMALIAAISGRYRSPMRFVVNDLLMAVEPLSDTFLPINKHGAQCREAAGALDAAMASDMPVAVFPAGLVSRLGKGGEIRDLAWHKMFINKAVQHRRDIVPVHISGENSRGFYRMAMWRKRLGIGFNIEMLRLPAEVFRSRGKTLTITIGKPIPYSSLGAGRQAAATAEAIKESVYALSPSTI